MPSVNLSRLRLQAFELAGLLGDPAAFRNSLRALLEEHSHRLLRRNRSLVHRSALPAWDVPGLLIREVEASLLPAARKDGRAALAASVAVWEDGRLEEKQLAAFLAGLSGEPGEIRNRLLEWLAGTEDPVLLGALSSRTCPPLWKSNAVLYRSDVRSWIESTVPAIRRFGWMALCAWTEEKASESVFAAFELLPRVFSESDPEALQLGSDLLRRLAGNYPRETQGWISELPDPSFDRGRKFLRRMLARLPEETAAILRSRLTEG